MALRPKDNPCKGDDDKSAGRKTPAANATKKGVLKATSSVAKGKTNPSTESEGDQKSAESNGVAPDASKVKKVARDKKSVGTKNLGSTTKKAKKALTGVKAFQEFLGERVSHSQQAVLSRDRTVIDHLVFAIFLENGSFEQARRAFLEIMNYFVDWNEVRVSKASEMVDVIGEIPCAVVACERLRRLLQWIFDKTYDFDLEGLRQKGENELLDFISSIPYSTRFMKDYVKLFAFGGVDLPLNEGSLRIMRLLGLVKVVDDEEYLDDDGDKFDEVGTINFFFQLHGLGVELMDATKSGDVLDLLKEFDKESAKRSDAPLAPPKNYDPIEIARQLARMQKAEVGKSPTSRMYDAPSDTDLDEDTDDFEIDPENVDEAQEVSETSLSAGETTYSSSEKIVSSASSRHAHNKNESETFKTGSVERDLFVEPGNVDVADGSAKSPKKTKKVVASKTGGKLSKKVVKQTSGSDELMEANEPETAKSSKQKKAKGSATTKMDSNRASQDLPEKPSSSRRRVNADISNVATSEPPDLSLNGNEGASCFADLDLESSAVNKTGENAGKSVKRAKTKASVAKVSKLTEIQQKKPR